MSVDGSLIIGCNHFNCDEKNCDDYITAKILYYRSRYKEVNILPMKVNKVTVICKLERVRENGAILRKGKKKRWRA